MRLITVRELAGLSEHELRLLCTHLNEVLKRTAPGSDDGRTLRASLEHARHALALKRSAPRPWTGRGWRSRLPRRDRRRPRVQAS